jgi:hypothetical protein
VIRRDIVGVGGDGDGCGEVDRLPAACRGVGEGGGGKLGAGSAPQIDYVLAGVVGAAVELDAGNAAGNIRLELDTHLELLTVVEVGLGRCAGGTEQAVGRGVPSRHGDVEGLVGG